MSKSKLIAKASLVLFIITLLSRFTGFFREMVIANKFGISHATDAFLVAYNFPNILFYSIGEAFCTVMVPIYTKYALQNKEKEFNKSLSSVLNLLLLLLASIVILGMLTSPLIVKFLAPRFDYQTQMLAAHLLRLMFPSVVFIVLSGILVGLLNANHVFGIGALSSFILNLSFIFLTILFSHNLGIDSLGLAVIVGTLLSFLLLFPWLKNVSFKYSFNLDYKDERLKEIFFLTFPIVIGNSINHLYLLIDNILASGMVEGSISSLNYASKVIMLPQNLLSIVLSTAIFPIISRLINQGKLEEFCDTLLRAMKLMIYLVLPCGAMVMLLRNPLVQILFQRGSFDSQATAMTSSALFYFSFSLIGQCLNPLLVKGFYALEDTTTPMKSTVYTVILNIICSIGFSYFLEYNGLALANSIAANFNILFLFYCLKSRINSFDLKDILVFLLKVLLCTIFMGLTVYLFNLEIHLPLIYQLISQCLLGVIVYFILSFLLKLDELSYLLTMGKKLLDGLLNGRR